MELYAEVKLEQENREGLRNFFSAFYGDGYDCRSKITYNEKDSEVMSIRIFFDDVPPATTIAAIPEIGKLIYFKTEQSDVPEKVSSQPEYVIEGTMKGEDGEQAKEEPDAGSDDRIKEEPEEAASIQKNNWNDELVAFRSKATSFEELMDMVAVWIQVSDDRRAIFSALMQSALHMEKITWANLLDEMRAKQVPVNTYDKKKLIDAVSDKTGGVSFIKFMKELLNLAKDMKKQESDPIEEQLTLKQPEENKALIELGCMRKHVTINEEYLQFEKELNNIDKGLWLEERVRQALVNSMGYQEAEAAAMELVRYAAALMQMAKVNCDNEKIKKQFQNAMTLRLRLTNIIAYTMEKYGGDGKAVTLNEFLTDFRKVIMTSDELQELEKQ